MRNLKLTVAYDGTNYHGFQRQLNQITVQQVLEEKLAKIFGHKLIVNASGRTDAKVHALGQVVSLVTTGSIPTENIIMAAQSVLPNAIAVIAVEEVARDFHARFSAKAKTYVYKIKSNILVEPFKANYFWLINKNLDIVSMQEATKLIVGEHDFSSFQASGSTPTVPIRKIFLADWQKKDDEFIFTIKGNGFLYHMVRNLVGTIVDVGLAKITAADFAEIMQAKDRKKAGKTAPPQGLYLQKVFY